MKRAMIHALSIGLGISFITQGAWAASFIVQMTGGLTFSPASLSIAQGASVTWTNVSAFGHTSNSGTPPSGDGLWASSNMNPAAAFTVTFTKLRAKLLPLFLLIPLIPLA